MRGEKKEAVDDRLWAIYDHRRMRQCFTDRARFLQRCSGILFFFFISSPSFPRYLSHKDPTVGPMNLLMVFVASHEFSVPLFY